MRRRSPSPPRARSPAAMQRQTSQSRDAALRECSPAAMRRQTSQSRDAALREPSPAAKRRQTSQSRDAALREPSPAAMRRQTSHPRDAGRSLDSGSGPKPSTRGAPEPSALQVCLPIVSPSAGVASYPAPLARATGVRLLASPKTAAMYRDSL